MYISEGNKSDGDLTGNFTVGPNELELQALIDDNETSVYTTEQSSRACSNEQNQSTNGKYFVYSS